MLGTQNRSLNSVSRSRTVLLLVALLLCQESSGSFIKLRPNTLREFQFLQCRGDYDKERYATLSRVCDDCHNLFRQPQVMTECKSNCFRNSLFLTCVSLLKLEHLEDDFKDNILVVSGNDP
ncbi:crustacean hyperglycemic hormone-like [Penaeus japonicus]|uniref:crustacean hyperglycemic hormone-like n=1 Tax=Penaeus japonicus TaxID=27405 RepID=UPI001C70D18B|nr:crustacean hyperglycemic hormone-like [Penaeus japonicus]